MCKNAAGTAASLMKAIEPTLISILALTGNADTPEGKAAIQAYDAALLAVQNWKSGSTAENVLQLIVGFQQVFNVIPIPDQYKVLANVILAGVEAVIGVLIANSPAPPAPVGLKGVADAKALHQATVAADTTVKIHTLVPGIKLSRFYSAESQYNHAWNKAVEQGGFGNELKVA